MRRGLKVTDLDDDEQLALVVLAKAMVHADGVVSKDEILDLMSLGEAIGRQRFATLLARTKDQYKDRTAVYKAAEKVRRRPARELIVALLEGLAEGDGKSFVEHHHLMDIREFWELQ